MFRLVRYFSISSAVSLTAVAIVLVIFYRHTAMTELVGMAESQNATLARSFANTIWPRFSRYLKSFAFENAEAFRSSDQTQKIHDELQSMTARLPVLKVKIYKLDGYTVFSSEISQIGENKSDNPGFLMAARQGKVASKLAFRDTFSAFEGTVQERDLVESYVPIRLADGSIVGVFELYSDVTPVTQRIGRTTTTLVIGLFLIFSALYGLLYLIIRRADQTLKGQYLALQTSEEDIKAKNSDLEFEISEREQSEELQRTAKQEAENANQAKSRFFAAASHDLRQPLHTISLYLPLLAKAVTTPESREIVDAIQLSCTSMENLLNGLLDISKLEAGVVSPEIESVPTRHLFQKLAVEFTVQANENDVELRVVPVDLSVVTDPTLFERVLRNLLSNAVQHTRHGRVLFGARRRGSQLRFEIWDTGVGIAEDQLTRIFQEFYQIGNLERDSSQGLGLGLAIVDRVTRLLGHRVEVKSVLGKGSMFAVEAPIDVSARFVDPPPPVGEQPGEDLTGILVLLVEDNVEVLKSTKSSLEDWGCRVIEAQSIEQAVARTAESGRPPDFILADFRLRDDETGAAAIERVCRLTGRSVPAAIITGDTDPKRLREATESGYVLLHKPVRPGHLRSLLASQCRAAIEQV